MTEPAAYGDDVGDVERKDFGKIGLKRRVAKMKNNNNEKKYMKFLGERIIFIWRKISHNFEEILNNLKIYIFINNE